MMTKTGIAFAVTLVICIAPCTMAHQGTHHEHTNPVTHSYGYGGAYPYGEGEQWAPAIGYGTTLPLILRIGGGNA